VQRLSDARGALAELISRPAPTMLEVDMLSVGSFKTAFAGPPLKAAQ
jgi:acetolactate synthase-1/2/3 large subunit